MLLTAVVIGASLEGFTKCRSISNNISIKEKLLGHCTEIASGFLQNRRNVSLRKGFNHG